MSKELTLKEEIDRNYGLTVKEYCDLLAKSEMVPSVYRNKTNDIFVALSMGYEVGMKPIAALSNICVINGKPSLYGDGAIALCLQSGELENIEMYYDEEQKAGICIVKRKGKEPHKEIFSEADAHKAGLLSKGVWKLYPKRMLQVRARAFALRNVFADKLLGLSFAEEVMDYEKNINSQTIQDHTLKMKKEAEMNNEVEQDISDGEIVEDFDPMSSSSSGSAQSRLLERIFVLDQELDEETSSKLDARINQALEALQVKNISDLEADIAERLLAKLMLPKSELIEWLEKESK